MQNLAKWLERAIVGEKQGLISSWRNVKTDYVSLLLDSLRGQAKEKKYDEDEVRACLTANLQSSSAAGLIEILLMSMTREIILDE